MLLGDASRRRDLLIEHLHRIQDAYHQISAAHLAALAEEMRLSLAEVFETATFYAHFDVVREGDPALPPVTIRVCDSIACAMAGAESLFAELRDAAGPAIRVLRAPLHRSLRQGSGRGRRPCAGWRCHAAAGAGGGEGRGGASAAARPCRSRSLSGRRRLCAAGAAALRRPFGRSGDRCARFRFAAWPRRRGLSDRTQVAHGARRASAAAHGRERRRRRARHLQGPLLPRKRSASLPRRHVDRRSCGRGHGRLHLHPRRIS